MLKTTNPGIEYWKPVSNINKGITKEAAWNIIAASFDIYVWRYKYTKKMSNTLILYYIKYRYTTH